jgi:hypothetical protein
MKDGCEKAFGPLLEIKVAFGFPPGIDPFNQISFCWPKS